jgi:hypothetical protein
MCLIAKPGSILTAKRDIITYKVVDMYLDEPDAWRGYYFRHKKFEFDAVINEGGMDESRMEKTFNKMYLQVGKGFLFSTKNKKILEGIAENTVTFNKNIRAVVCKCAIPKGTKYYKYKNEYASEKLIVHKPKPPRKTSGNGQN